MALADKFPSHAAGETLRLPPFAPIGREKGPRALDSDELRAEARRCRDLLWRGAINDAEREELRRRAEGYEEEASQREMARYHRSRRL